MKLAIKGHPTRGKEVMNILKSLGGKMPSDRNWTFEYEQIGYFIRQDDFISNDHIDVLNDPKYIIYTLEEFEQKYPYKVGDKVLYLNIRKEWVEGIIDKMHWNESNSTLYYYVNNIDGTSAGRATTMFLKPMKQKELKDYLKPGYVVEYDDGLRLVITQDVHGNNFGLQIGGAIMWADFSQLDGIIKVYQINKPGALHKTYTYDTYLTLVWEKPKEVELTMQQIADRFGIDVTQLKIKK